jgi:hypothetical protein
MLTKSELAQYNARFGAFDPNLYNVTRWEYYDTVVYPLGAVGPTQLQFFVVPQGGADPISALAKSTEDTNLSQSGTFGRVSFFLRQVRMNIGLKPRARQTDTTADDVYSALLRPNQATIARIAHQGVLTIKLNNWTMPQIQQPFLRAPAGFGLDITNHAASSAAANEVTSLWTQGDQNLDNVYYLPYGKLIPENCTVQVAMDYPNGAAPALSVVSTVRPNVAMRLVFSGIIIRPAQG